MSTALSLVVYYYGAGVSIRPCTSVAWILIALN